MVSPFVENDANLTANRGAHSRYYPLSTADNSKGIILTQVVSQPQRFRVFSARFTA